MSRAGQNLRTARAEREAARLTLSARRAQLTEDLEARGIAGRVTDRLAADARDSLDEALAIANESKGVIAGTTAALGLWFFRRPLADWIHELLPDATGENKPLEEDHPDD